MLCDDVEGIIKCDAVNAARVGREVLVTCNVQGIEMDLWDVAEIDGHARTWRGIFCANDGTEGNFVGAGRKSVVLVTSFVLAHDEQQHAVDNFESGFFFVIKSYMAARARTFESMYPWNSDG